MIGTKELENSAREIKKTGKLEIVFTIEKEAIDKMLISSFTGFAETCAVESESLWTVAYQIIQTYHKMKRERRL